MPSRDKFRIDCLRLNRHDMQQLAYLGASTQDGKTKGSLSGCCSGHVSAIFSMILSYTMRYAVGVRWRPGRMVSTNMKHTCGFAYYGPSVNREHSFSSLGKSRDPGRGFPSSQPNQDINADQRSTTGTLSSAPTSLAAWA